MDDVPETSSIGGLLGAVLKACGGDTSARSRVSGKDQDLDALALAVNQLIALLGMKTAECAKALEACAAAAERYQRLEAIIPGLAFVYRFLPDGIPYFPYVSAGVRDLFHLEPEDLMRDGSLLANMAHPEDRERRDRAIQQSFETLRPFRMQMRHIVDGEIRWHDVMSRVQREPDGCVQGYGIILEITGRKRAEEALRESEAKYRHLYESMMDGFATVNMEGRYTDCNPTYERMLGYSREELRQLTYYDSTPEKWHPLIARIAEEQVLARGFSDVYEKEYRRKDGSVFPVELRTFLMRDGAGRPSAMCTVARDIPERKKAEEERSELEARLFEAQKLESVGRLAGGVAHDFNNMLTVILGFTRLALSKLRPYDPLSADLAEIEKAATHSKEITRQLLAFSRRQIVKRQPTNLNDLIASRKSMLSRLIGEDVDLRFFPSEEAQWVNVDTTQIEQILVNLAVNARDAMPQGGILTVETEGIVIDAAYCRLHPESTPGNYVRLTIGDTGAGMDRETLAHCFEPFFTTKETGRGTGLGLATVYGIVKQNEGFVYVQSEPGRGTTFQVYLRATGVASASLETGLEVPPAKGEGTILLVEDEEMVRRLTAEMLKTLGYTVVSAGTPAEALSICQTAKRDIDLVLTDVTMPGMNGMQLRDQVLALMPEVKVLFMSGFASNNILRGNAEESLDFIQKPFSMNDLGRAIRAALARDAA
jgi:PAS domain S-box-containing protein